MKYLLALVLACAPEAAMAQWTGTTVPTGNGFSSSRVQGPSGQTWTGTTVPRGNGFSSQTWQDNAGNQVHCATVPMGSGSRTTCR